ncbi:hypothetical protein PR048_006542 [Dryococelus australis]|uniref:Ribosomal protein S10 n=1 Tax=Dryococelus australis TaxID=614101 RepID=A0ABQ9IBC8_9NEOP|nr:hypothetical protein PR048_006542 [Dryococelus australis]
MKRTDRVYTVNNYIEIMLHFTEIIDFPSCHPFYFKKSMLSAKSAGRGIPKDRKVNLQPSCFSQMQDVIALPTTTFYPAGKRHTKNDKLEYVRKLRIYLPHNVKVHPFYQ